MNTDSTPRIVTRAAALLIGSELLSGKVRDENLHSLACALRALGIELDRVIICPDELATIARDIRTLSTEYDLIITSGGVGPTHDDITIEGVAKGLDRKTVESSRLRRLLEEHYEGQLDTVQLTMAQVPEGAELLIGGNVRWPVIVVGKVWILPGVPELFRMKLSALRTHVRGPAPFYSEELLLNAEETEIKAELDRLVASHPDVDIGSYPKCFEPRYKTRLTFDSRSSIATHLAFEDASRQFSQHVTSVT